MDNDMYRHFSSLLCRSVINEKEVIDEFSSLTKTTPFDVLRKNKKQVRTLCELIYLAYTSNTLEFLKHIVHYGYKHPNILSNFKEILELMYPFETSRHDADEKEKRFLDMVTWTICTFKSLSALIPVYEHILLLRPSLFFVFEEHNISHILKPTFLVGLINYSNKSDAAFEYARGVIHRLGINHPAVVQEVHTHHMVRMCMRETNIRFLRMLHDDFSINFGEVIGPELIQIELSILAAYPLMLRENLYETIWFFRSIGIDVGNHALLQEAAEFYKNKFLHFVMKTQYSHNLCEDVLYMIGRMI